MSCACACFGSCWRHMFEQSMLDPGISRFAQILSVASPRWCAPPHDLQHGTKGSPTDTSPTDGVICWPLLDPLCRCGNASLQPISTCSMPHLPMPHLPMPRHTQPSIYTATATAITTAAAAAAALAAAPFYVHRCSTLPSTPPLDSPRRQLHKRSDAEVWPRPHAAGHVHGRTFTCPHVGSVYLYLRRSETGLPLPEAPHASPT